MKVVDLPPLRRIIVNCTGVVAATKIFIVVASVCGRNNNLKMDEITRLAIESS